jgi:glyoxylase-like metal-dependent hydrolase (beta-lactamase superfamily II)
VSIPIHAVNPGPFTGAGNWTYLFPGPSPVLFDAGVGHPEHIAAVAAAAADGPSRVIVSHAHPDHASGVPALLARWPSIAVGKIPWVEKDDANVAWQVVGEGDIIETGEGRLQVIHTPGHAPDHIALWDAESRTLYAADLMQLGNTVAIPSGHGGDLTVYLRSLRRVQALAPARVLPAHGPVIEDPLTLIDQYLKHRHQREVQVIAALELRLETVEAITDRIYTGLSPQLTPLARQSVLAHLVKLEQDGLARQDGSRWTLLT